MSDALLGVPDPAVCTVCGELLTDGTPVQYDLDGAGAHAACLDIPNPDDEERDE